MPSLENRKTGARRSLSRRARGGLPTRRSIGPATKAAFTRCLFVAEGVWLLLMAVQE